MSLNPADFNRNFVTNVKKAQEILFVMVTDGMWALSIVKRGRDTGQERERGACHMTRRGCESPI